MDKTSILRLAARSRLVSAQVFEDLFEDHHGAWFKVTRQEHSAFFTRVLGPADRPVEEALALERFAETAGAYDFICPGFQSTRLIPALLNLRNRSGESVRLLFINHSPGAFAYVFSLLPGLIRPGDVIIAPSTSGANVITTLAPALAPFVHKVHHPMSLFGPCGPVPDGNTILTLGRLVPDKLIHIQIEALARLRKTTGRDVRMVLAGETRNLDTGRTSAYVRSLKAACRRLDLTDKVSFPGVLSGRKKAALLNSASLMLYLSATLEETFPKGAVEGLGAGLPVVATHWNGFSEVVGDCGVLVRFDTTASHALEISPDAVAHAMACCLNNPPAPAECRRQAARFSPELARAGYEKAVTQALALNPGSTARVAKKGSSLPSPDVSLAALTGDGLLAGLPFLGRLSFDTAFAEYLSYACHIRRSWESGTVLPDSDAGYTTDLTTSMALKRTLEYLYAGIAGGNHRYLSPESGPAPDKIGPRLAWSAAAALDRDTATACLLRLTDLDRPDLVETALKTIGPQFCRARAYAETWLLCRRENPARALERFLSAFKPEEFRAHEWPLLQQLGCICQQGGDAGTIAAVLGQWLEKYPDCPGSGIIWLDHAQALGAHQGWDDPGFLKSLNQAEMLLGESKRLRRLKARALAATVAVESSP